MQAAALKWGRALSYTYVQIVNNRKGSVSTYNLCEHIYFYSGFRVDGTDLKMSVR